MWFSKTRMALFRRFRVKAPPSSRKRFARNVLPLPSHASKWFVVQLFRGEPYIMELMLCKYIRHSRYFFGSYIPPRRGTQYTVFAAVLAFAARGRRVFRMSQGLVFWRRGEVSRRRDSFEAGPASSPVHMRYANNTCHLEHITHSIDQLTVARS